MRALAALATAAALAGSAGPAVRVPAKDVAAVSLAGSRVVWARNAPLPEVYVGKKLVWRATPVPVPPGAEDARYRASVTQRIEAMAASPRLLAFIYVVELTRTPRCVDVGCRPVITSTRLRGELWAGPVGRRLRRISRDVGYCVPSVGVSGALVVVAIGSCGPRATRVQVISLGTRRPRTVFDRRIGFVVDEVALRWPYVAWYQRHAEFSHGQPPDDGVVVTDLRSRHVTYHIGPSKLYTNSAPALDVEGDGALGLVVDRAPRIPPCSTNQLGVAWASPSAPHLHFVRTAWTDQMRVRRGRLVFIRARSCETTGAQLVLVEINGRTRVVASPGPGAAPYDFDGRRLAWVAADGIHVARVR